MEHPKAYFSHISIQKIRPSKLNPRRTFDPAQIAELAASFSEYGMIQPIIVFPDHSSFVIVCGERRWRAAKKAKFTEIPAIIYPVPLNDDVAISMALVENTHRQDMDLIGESCAIRNLIEEYSWSKRQVAKKLGVSASYVRSRMLLTKFTDVLDSYDDERISFSEAIELASVEDSISRNWFLRRLLNREFESFRKFCDAVSRYKVIVKKIEAKQLLSQPIDQAVIQLEVPSFPYCDAHCKHYLCLTWEERKHFGLPTERPGWAEYCTSAGDNNCYSSKKGAKYAYLQSLRQIQVKRPIPDDGWESMLWFRHDHQICSACKSLVDSSDFEEIGHTKESGSHAYCIDLKPHCYNKRHKAYQDMVKRRDDIRNAVIEERKQQILSHISPIASRTKRTARSYITKSEAIYLILQFLCYGGGRTRLERFAKQHSFQNHLPSQYSDQIIYIKNKLMESMSDIMLLEILFIEAASTAAYSHEEIEPMQFDRSSQRALPIIGQDN